MIPPGTRRLPRASTRVRWTKHLLLGAGLLSICVLGSFHQAALAQSRNTVCNVFDAAGDLDCITSINVQQFATLAYQNQEATEWCWAASISMIFAFYGHPVPQSEIVSSTFGQLINQGGQPSQIFAALNGAWTDDNNVMFTSTVTGLYDFLDNIDTISYTDIGSALNQNQPVLIGTINPDGSGAHATVLSSLEYLVPYGGVIEVLPDGSNIVNAVVFDPWPTSGGLHTIPWPQFEPAGLGGNLFFSAIASVTTDSTGGNGNSGTGNSGGGGGGGGGTDWFSLLFLAALAVLRWKKCVDLPGGLASWRASYPDRLLEAGTRFRA
jgi:uncharacterized membrane protein YgcG